MSPAIGPIIFDLMHAEVTPEEVDMLNHPSIGGVIFFSRHFESKSQITSLIKEIRGKRKAPLLITVDQEGGRVQRFKSGFTAIPAMSVLGETYDRSATDALRLSFLCGYILAAELAQIDIDISFAPVLDLHKKLNLAIGDRAFHADPDTVIQLAQQFILGLHAAGLAAVGKHFPGHGSIVPDTHHTLAEDVRPLSEIRQDLKPFAALIAQGLLAGIMPAHIIFSSVDPHPVGFSTVWLKNILQKTLNFQGMILSDDLSMRAVSANMDITTRCESALSAGCDMLLICNDRPSVIKALDRLPQQHIAFEKFLNLKRKKNLMPMDGPSLQREFMALGDKYDFHSINA